MLAMRIADEAAEHPERFEALARQYSDDVVTAETGGSLGGVRAGQLPPTFIDALAVLRPGQVSRVVQTAFGYHILMRRAVPEPMHVSGRRIAIRYAETYNGRELDEKLVRTREQALALARDVAQQASTGAPFDELVKKYSDLVDKDEGGYMGTWSVRDPGFMPVEVEQLAKLRVGEVSAPIDSMRGFEILQRLETHEDSQFAMSDIQLPFDPTAAPGTSSSEDAVREEARNVIARVRSDPAEFDRVRERTCCRDPLRWNEGRGPAGVTPALKRVGIGQLAPEPILGEQFYFIAKRIDPSTVPESPEPSYEIPIPKGVDLDAVVKFSTGKALAINTRLLKSEVAKNLRLDAVRGNGVALALDRLATGLEATGTDDAARLNRWHAALDEIRKVLGKDDFARFNTFLEDWATHRALAQPT